MKKLTVILAALLLCSQAANSQGLRIIPRAEYSTGQEDHLAQTSLFTVFEGTISDNFSFYTQCLWLNSAPGDLYSSTLRSDSPDWVNMAYITYATDRIELNLGKIMGTYFGHEYDADDFDCHFDLASNTWMNLLAYQLGLSGCVYFGEHSAMDFCFTPSPYGEWPYASKLFAGSLGYNFTAGGLNILLRDAMFQHTTSEKPLNTITLSARYDADDWFVFNELRMGNAFCDPEDLLMKGVTDVLHAEKTISEKWSVDAVGIFEKCGHFHHFRTGAFAYYFPIPDLRIHALAGYDFKGANHGFFAAFGLTYNLAL